VSYTVHKARHYVTFSIPRLQRKSVQMQFLLHCMTR